MWDRAYREIHKIILISLLLVIGLSACTPEPAFTPTPTATPRADASLLTPTPLINGTEATQVPTPEPIVGVDYPVGPDSYPEHVNPLTGLPVADPASLDRRPLAVKVSNDANGRPNTGLSFADIVFEHYTEGGVTRLTAILYSQSPERIGSLRSGRLIDLEIVPMFDALYAASGFSGGVKRRMDDVTWLSRNYSSPYGFEEEPYMIRQTEEGRAYEHTLYAVPNALWDLADQRNTNQRPDMTPGMAFMNMPPAGGEPVSSIIIDFSFSYNVEWVYDPGTRKYTRYVAGKPDIDNLTGQPVMVDNVIAVGALHIDTDIVEDGYNGLPSTEIQLWGEGPVSLFRDGQRYEGGWARLDPSQFFTLTTLNNEILYFKPGTTWFEVVPIGFDKLYVEP